MFVDHIAVLTADLRAVSDALPAFCRKEPIESFPAEGTKEQYVELAERAPRLLLLEPIAEGPYARALRKRGPGLHHIGAKTRSIEASLPTIRDRGLLLHPISIQTLERGVVWLCRPGVPFLIELVEGADDAGLEALDLGLSGGCAVPPFADGLFSNARLYAASGEGVELKAGERLVRLPRS